MRRSLRYRFVAAAIVGLLVVGFSSPSRATVLLFDYTPAPGFGLGQYETTFSNYGDNVTATSMSVGLPVGYTYLYGMGNGFTPDITIDYSHSAAQVLSAGHTPTQPQGQWSDPVDYLHYIDGTQFWYTFTPTGDNGVDVNSFAIDLFAGSGTLNWRLREDSTTGNVFASGTETSLLVSDPDRIVTIPNGSYFGTVVLEIDFVTSNAGNIGIDDLNFDQIAPPAPEPNTALMLGLGVVGLAALRKRKAN